MIRRRPKQGEKPGKVLGRRSRYSNRYTSKPAKIFTANGRITGYELSDGTIVVGKDCCERPWECHRPECWHPLAKPWWMGPVSALLRQPGVPTYFFFFFFSQ
jgi:hypothetical protein